MRDTLCSKEKLEETFEFNVEKIKEKEEKMFASYGDIN